MVTISTMTIEEAIEHAEETAEMNQVIADNTEHENWMNIAECEKCAADHRQLAAWLRELQERRKRPEIILCKDCKYYKEYGYVNGRPKFLPKCGFSQIYVDSEDFCSRAERKDTGLNTKLYGGR